MKRISLSVTDKLNILFTGPFIFIGLIFSLIGVFMFTMLDGFPSANSIFFKVMEPVEIQGEVTKTGETNTTINGNKVLYVEYEFVVNNKKQNATINTIKRVYTQGDEITVEYLPDFFSISNIKGSEPETMNILFFLVFGIFPIIGIFYVFREVRRMNRVTTILSDFKLSKAILKEKKVTSTKVNNRSVYKMIYEYHPINSNLINSFKTIKPNFFSKEELLVYANRHPENAVILKRLPESVAKQIMAFA